MKEYVKPLVIENDDRFEGVYAASGDDYDYWATVVNNNSGSLSVVKLNFQLRLDHGGETITMVIAYSGPGKITAIRGASGADFSLNGDGNVITITRNNHYNSGETIAFNVNEMEFSERADGTTDEENGGHHGSLFLTGTEGQDVTAMFSIVDITFA